jgi:hypothetical protein
VENDCKRNQDNGLTSTSVIEVAKEVGVPYRTARWRVRQAEEFADLPPSLQEKVDQGPGGSRTEEAKKEAKDAAKRDAFNLWLACSTQDEIAEAVGWPQKSVGDWLKGISENGKNTESANTVDSDDDDGDSPFELSKAELAAAVA